MPAYKGSLLMLAQNQLVPEHFCFMGLVHSRQVFDVCRPEMESSLERSHLGASGNSPSRPVKINFPSTGEKGPLVKAKLTEQK